MRIGVLAISGCLLISANSEAAAVTFTPDMWLYEVSLVPDRLDLNVSAWADAPPGTLLPMGCTGSDVAVYEGRPYIEVRCNGNPGIDVYALLGGPDRFNLPAARIGFNASTIVCEGGLILGCPSTPEETYADYLFYNVDKFDALNGILSFCTSIMWGGFAECYDLSPTHVSVPLAVVNVGNPSGAWDFGYGGYWTTGSPDNPFYYSGSGRLVSSPAVVPLPASFVLLGLALLGLGSVRRTAT